jgi:hypothetical protein
MKAKGGALESKPTESLSQISAQSDMSEEGAVKSKDGQAVLGIVRSLSTREVS